MVYNLQWAGKNPKGWDRKLAGRGWQQASRFQAVNRRRVKAGTQNWHAGNCSKTGSDKNWLTCTNSQALIGTRRADALKLFRAPQSWAFTSARIPDLIPSTYHRLSSRRWWAWASVWVKSHRSSLSAQPTETKWLMTNWVLQLDKAITVTLGCGKQTVQ